MPLSCESNKLRETFHNRFCVISPAISKASGPSQSQPSGYDANSTQAPLSLQRLQWLLWEDQGSILTCQDFVTALINPPKKISTLVEKRLTQQLLLPTAPAKTLPELREPSLAPWSLQGAWFVIFGLCRAQGSKLSS